MNSYNRFSGVLWVGVAVFCSPLIAQSGTSPEVAAGLSFANARQANGETASSEWSLVPGETIAVSRSDLMVSIENVLATPCPSISATTEPFQKVMSRMHEMGIPVWLHRSAVDDELDWDTQISRGGTEGLPLYVQLCRVLEEYNASLQLDGDQARIVSMDVVDDPEFYTTLTYDVTQLTDFDNHPGLSSVIAKTVGPDGWSGTGTGDQTMAFSKVNGHTLMSISAPWSEHVKIRRFLAQLTSLSATELPMLGSLGGSAEHGPNQFACPEPPARQAGGGGMGGGVGAFSVDGGQ